MNPPGDCWRRWDTRPAIALLGLIVFCLIACPVEAQYRFTRIADTSGPFLGFGMSPSINANGQVAFWTLENGRSGIYASDGETLTTIADTSGSFRFFRNPVINAAGQVAFYAYHDLERGRRLEGIYRSDGNTLIKISDESDNLTDFNYFPTMNDAGQVAFTARTPSGDLGIYVGNGNTLTKIADTFEGFFDNFGDASINAAGEVFFTASRSSDHESIYRANANGITLLLDNSGLFRVSVRTFPSMQQGRPLS